MKHIFLLFLSTASFLILTAQENTLSTKINVFDEFRSNIPEPIRLNERAVFIDTSEIDRKQDYQIFNIPLNLNYETRALKAAKVRLDQTPQIFRNNILFSLGNKWSTKIYVSHNNKYSKTLNYGGFLTHYSNKFKTNNNLARYKLSNARLYLKEVKLKYIFHANFNYQRKTVDSYGHILNINKEILENRFAYSKFFASLESQELSAEKLKHHTQFFFSDLNENSENRIHLSSVIKKNIKGISAALNIDFDNYSNYNSKQDIEGLSKIDLQLFSITPSVNLKKFDIDFDFGLGIDYDSEGVVDLFPSIIATKELVQDILLISAGIEDDRYRNTYKSLSDRNPFIYTLGTNQILIPNNISQDLRITESKEIFFSIKNVLGNEESLDIETRFGKVENLSYFDIDFSSDHNRFVVHYQDAFQLQANISYYKKINQSVSLNIVGDFYHWNKDIAHKPKLILELSSPINLRDKIKIYPAVRFQSKRYSFSQIVDSLSLPNPDYEYELGSQFHFDVDVYYIYSKKLSAYILLHNLLNSKKEIWRGYKEIGFVGQFGCKYSF